MKHKNVHRTEERKYQGELMENYMHAHGWCKSDMECNCVMSRVTYYSLARNRIGL